MPQRDLETIVGIVLNFVPTTFSRRDELQAALNRVIEASRYHPPEARRNDFLEVATALEVLGEPDCTWKRAIKSVMSDTPFQESDI